MHFLRGGRGAIFGMSAALALAVWSVSGLSGYAADASLMARAMASITPDDLTKHVETLADDTFEGREAGSRGGHAAAGYLVDKLKKIGVAPAGDQGSYYQSFGDQYRNILAVIEGSDPELKNEVLLVGAHYDHVGYGTQRNSFGPIGYIHNGADDNASGTAGLVEVIEAFISSGIKPRRTILFAFWDGEEMGLLGSKYWIKHPTVPLDRVAFAINIDMIGRLRQERVTVYGTRTGTGLRELVAEQNRFTNLFIDFDWEMKADSDHFTFFEARIPVMMLHTGLHNDYHRPSDDSNKLNYTGLAETSRFLLSIVEGLADASSLPKFRRDSIKESKRDREALERPLAPAPPRLGVTWDERKLDERGMLVQRVESKSSAYNSGLRSGDRLLKFDGRDITSGDELRRWIVTAPEKVKLTVLHAGEREPVELEVELLGKPLRLGVSWRDDPSEPNSIVVVRVVPGSAGHTAGIRVNDRIQELNGQAFTGGAEFLELVSHTTGPIELLVERSGRHETVKLP